jgi:glycosyltransferase involved in cell wall biosynthesis
MQAPFNPWVELAQPGGYTLLLRPGHELDDEQLKALRSALAADQRLAAVAPLLVADGGRVCGAGGLVWDDGSLATLDEDVPGGAAAVSFAAEPDYLDAAPLLVRSDLLAAVRSELDAYRTTAYSGAHLALRARERGMSVALVPGVRVDEGPAAAPGDLAADRQELLRQNASQLVGHLPSGPRGGLLQARQQARGWVLVCDQWIPAPDRDSGSLRMSSLLDLLRRQGHRVTFFSAHEEPREPYESAMQAAGIEVQRGLGRFAPFCEGRAGLYDRVILSRPHVARALLGDVQRSFPDAALVYDTVDLTYLREGRRLELEGGERGDEYRALLDEENRLQQAADITIAITESEADLVRQANPGLVVHVLPNVHRVEPGPVPAFEERRGVMFIGGFAHPPNVDAVEHFVGQIQPLLDDPDGTQFFVLGSDPPPRVTALQSPRVIVTGHVADVGPYFASARVFVAPLRYGAGMKGKVGQAMAYGLPVVTSAIGAEGMDLEDGRDVLVADDPPSFAAATMRLYRDRALWEELSRRSREVVAERWTPEAVAPRMASLLELCRQARDRHLAANHG